MPIPSLADQDYENQQELFYWNNSRPGQIHRRRPKLVEQPAIIWSKEYESQQGVGKLLRIIQELSDYMLLNKSGLYTGDNPNQPYLVDAVKGFLNPEDYKAAVYTYGEKTNTPIRDTHFYYPSKSLLTNQISAQPLEFHCKNISSEYTAKQIRDAARKASKIATNVLTEYTGASGVDLSFAEDESVNMAGSTDDILSQLRGTEKLEYIIYKLVQDIIYRHDLREIERDCFMDKYDINAEFALIEIINGDVRPRHLRPDQVLWVAGKPIRTLEDDSVIAASTVDYLTVTEILNKYTFKLKEGRGTGAQGIMDVIQHLRQGQMSAYDPTRHYFTEYYYANGLTSDPFYPGPQSLNATARIEYNQAFYPYFRTGHGLSYTMLEQKIFFKMIVPKRYIVEINGKPATEKTYKEWQKNDFQRKLNATFEEVDTDEKLPKGAFTREHAKVELWEATRLGHNTLVDVGRYKYTTSKKGRSGYVGMPIVAQISYDKSFALLGHHFAILTTITYQRIEELVVEAGLGTAILFDTSVGENPRSFLFAARKSGIAFFNSEKMRGGPTTKYQHLDTISLGKNMEEVERMLQFIGMLKMLFENMIGASPQAQGVPQAYAGLKETQLNIANQSQLAQGKFYEHGLFMNQLLQRIADIAKKEYAKDEYINVRVSEAAYETLKLMKELDQADVDILLRSGPDLKSKKDLINNAIDQLMAAGGIEMLEALIEMYITDNPNEALAILRKNTDRIAEAQAARDKQLAEAENLRAQTETEKSQVPIQVAKVNQETQLAVQDKKMQERANSEDLKGHMQDIKHYQEQDNRVLESDLRREEASAANQEGLDRDMAFAQMDNLLNSPPQNENPNQ